MGLRCRRDARQEIVLLGALISRDEVEGEIRIFVVRLPRGDGQSKGNTEEKLQVLELEEGGDGHHVDGRLAQALGGISFVDMGIVDNRHSLHAE